MRWRWSIGVVLLLATGCGTAHPTLDELDAVPGADTAYPHSQTLGSSRIESDHNLMASNPATIKRDACTADDASRVLRWYDAELEGAGWSRAPGAWPASGVGDFRWRRHDRVYQLRLASTGAASGTCVTSIRTTVS